MKNNNKLKFIALVAIMLLIVAVPTVIYATVTSTSTANITINNVTTGDTVAAYKIIDITFDDASNSYQRTWNTSFQSYFDNLSLTVDDFINIATETDLKEVLSGLSSYITTNNIQVTPVASADNKVVLEDLDMGGYFIMPQSSFDVYQTTFIPIEPTVADDGSYELNNKEIAAKKSEISIDIDVDKTSATINEKVTYTITVNLPSTYGEDGKNRFIKIGDVIEPGLVIDNDSYVVKSVNGSDEVVKTESTDFIFTKQDSDEFLLEISDSQYETSWMGQQQIVITFDATLTKDAPISAIVDGIRDGIDSNATLEYSIFPYEDNQTLNKTKTDSVEVYTYGIKINKVGVNDEVLSDAQFQLFSDSNCTNLIADVVIKDGNIVSTHTAISDTNGVATFDRLAEGTYYIKEIKAPAGYTLDKTAKEVEITSANVDEDGYYTIRIQNKKGLLLPMTGGNDAMIMTTIGIVLVIGATIALVVFSKKTRKVEK